jgi:hypothetical protein
MDNTTTEQPGGGHAHGPLARILAALQAWRAHRHRAIGACAGCGNTVYASPRHHCNSY